MNKIETWKQEKHGLDVWSDVARYAAEKTPMKQIDTADLERMKWHGVFYRKRDQPGHYMLRIRLTGCELSAAQAKEIAYVAYELGHGIVDITTRANIQVQGLPIENVPKAIARLQACGLTCKQTGHDNIRNVFGHPTTGIDPNELIDVRPLCRDISSLFLDSKIYSDLPRKFNIAVNGLPRHGLHYWSQDISYLAHRDDDGHVLFHVLLGGTQGQNPHLPWHLPVALEPDQVVDVTRAILNVFRERGSRKDRNRARFRFLIEEIGIPGVLDELEARLPYPLTPCLHEPAPPSGYDEWVGWLTQTDPAVYAMGLCVPLGRLSWDQLEGLSRIANRWGDTGLRTTAEQGLIVTGIRRGFRDAAATDAAGLKLSVNADTLSLNTMACTGKQFCNIAVTESKGQMSQLIDKLRQRGVMLHGIRIHMSGCPSSCAQHFTADIGLKGVRVRRLLGTREGYDVYLAGGISGRVNLAEPYRLGVDADQLPQLIEQVIADYYLKHKPGQSFSGYWRDKLRQQQADKVAEEEYNPPIWECDGCAYRHRGEDPPVFCPSCSALRRHFARLEDDPHDDQPIVPSPAVPSSKLPGYQFAARLNDVPENEGLAFEMDGQEVALFRVRDGIVAIDNACPHEGGPLSQGTIDGEVVTCPLHGWTFNACNGCSVSPLGHDVTSYETKIVDGAVFVRTAPSTRLSSAESLPA